jgi:hypothetical protein
MVRCKKAPHKGGAQSGDKVATHQIEPASPGFDLSFCASLPALPTVAQALRVKVFFP